MPPHASSAVARFCASASTLLSSAHSPSCHGTLSRTTFVHPFHCKIASPCRSFQMHPSSSGSPASARTLILACPSPFLMSIAPDTPPAGYRPNVGLCLVNADGKIFIARRIDLSDCWQMPQGGVDENEDPRSAALRELQEETGVTSAEIIGEVQTNMFIISTYSKSFSHNLKRLENYRIIHIQVGEWITYDFPPDVKVKITHLWGKEWTGQAQKWFLFRFKGDEKEINLDGDGIERAEFSDWKWASADEVLDRAVEFKRPVYQKVLDAFSQTLKWGS
ncbi:hypothetical protein KP509_26G012100 [Ceratopteris richardii]|uniref:Nudix hydrolase domain-containing protein n=1 Tax=Ceratopteris richardii TaxID=49495 RepID=A0A8T2RJR1_CERRI|nr:hypothetical protein KP509_26G012100 [Ceratopteris richardii]